MVIQMVRLMKLIEPTSMSAKFVFEIEKRKDTGSIYVGHKFEADTLNELLEETNYGIHNIHQSYFSSIEHFPNYELLLKCDNYGDFLLTIKELFPEEFI